MQNKEEFVLDLIDFESVEVQTVKKTDFYNMDDKIVLIECLESNVESICLFDANKIIEDDKLLTIAIKKYPFFLTKLENYDENMGLKILEKNVDLIMMFPSHFKTEKICKYVVSKNYLHLKEFRLEMIKSIENILQLLIISSPETSIHSIRDFYEKTIKDKMETIEQINRIGYNRNKENLLQKYKNLLCQLLFIMMILVFILLLSFTLYGIIILEY